MAHASLWGQFTKLRLWEQTQYEKIVYLDSDILVLGDLSVLFHMTTAPLAAVPGKVLLLLTPIDYVSDWDSMGKPSRELNGGMLVLRPNASLVPVMLEAARTMHPGITLEQSFLSRYFDWQVLSPAFNSPANMYLRAPSTFMGTRVVHYTHAKPWQPDDDRFQVWFRDVHELWWRAFDDMQRGYTFLPE